MQTNKALGKCGGILILHLPLLLTVQHNLNGRKQVKFNYQFGNNNADYGVNRYGQNHARHTGKSSRHPYNQKYFERMRPYAV